MTSAENVAKEHPSTCCPPFDILCLQNTSHAVMQNHIMPKMSSLYDCFGIEKASNDMKPYSLGDNFIMWNKDKFKKVSSGSFCLSDEPQKPASKSWDSTTVRNVVYCKFRRIETEESSMSDQIESENHEKPPREANEEEKPLADQPPLESPQPNDATTTTTSKSTMENVSLSDFYVFSTQLDQSDQARRYSMFLIREYIEQFLFEEEELEMERLGDVPVFLMGNFNALRDSPTMHLLLNGKLPTQTSPLVEELDTDTDTTDDDSEDNIALFDLRPSEHYERHHTFTGFETSEHHTQWPAVPKSLAQKAIFPQSFSSPRLGECSTDYIVSSIPFKVRNFHVHDQRVERTNRFPSNHRPVSCEVFLV